MEFFDSWMNIGVYIEQYFVWMLVYVSVKSVILGFLETPDYDIKIKELLLYPLYAIMGIGYVIGKIIINVVTRLLN